MNSNSQNFPAGGPRPEKILDVKRRKKEEKGEKTSLCSKRGSFEPRKEKKRQTKIQIIIASAVGFFPGNEPSTSRLNAPLRKADKISDHREKKLRVKYHFTPGAKKADKDQLWTHKGNKNFILHKEKEENNMLKTIRYVCRIVNSRSHDMRTRNSHT